MPRRTSNILFILFSIHRPLTQKPMPSSYPTGNGINGSLLSTRRPHITSCTRSPLEQARTQTILGSFPSLIAVKEHAAYRHRFRPIARIATVASNQLTCQEVVTVYAFATHHRCCGDSLWRCCKRRITIHRKTVKHHRRISTEMRLAEHFTRGLFSSTACISSSV